MTLALVCLRNSAKAARLIDGEWSQDFAMWRLSALAVACALAVASAAALTVSAYPSDATVRTIESQADMPPEAAPLDEYYRFYPRAV